MNGQEPETHFGHQFAYFPCYGVLNGFLVSSHQGLGNHLRRRLSFTETRA